MLGAQGLWAGRDLYRATPGVTRGFGFSGLNRRNVQFSRLLRHIHVGSIHTRILTGWHSVASFDTQENVEYLSLPKSSWVKVIDKTEHDWIGIASLVSWGNLCVGRYQTWHTDCTGEVNDIRVWLKLQNERLNWSSEDGLYWYGWDKEHKSMFQLLYLKYKLEKWATNNGPL
jgi:hypothetical protein